MPLNEKDEPKVLAIMKRINIFEEWITFCVEEIHKENIKLMEAWRDSD